MKLEILNDCPDLLRDFLFYLETIKGRSTKTVEAYYTDLSVFLRYLKCVKLGGEEPSKIDIADIKIADVSPELICSVTISDIYAYLNYTLSIRENKAQARSRKASSIRTFYNYITSKTDFLLVSPAENLEMPTTKKALPKFLSLEESLRLISTVQAAENERDYCMITMLINCGMRVSELVGINLSDLRLADKTLRLLGKGNKERIIYINFACIEAIEKYIPVRKMALVKAKRNDEKALFLSSRHSRITTRRVEQILEDYLKQADLDGRGYSPHKLRHTAATLMYLYGNVDVMILKEILGHEHLGTTEIYTHVSSKQMHDAADASPLSNIKPTPKRKPNPTKPSEE